MTVSNARHGSSWKRYLVGITVALLVVIVALQIVDQGGLSEVLAEVPPGVAYLLCFLLVWFDGVIPIFPGETTLSTASTMAAEGDLQLGYVMLAGALGAIVGDSSLFWIARTKGDRVRPKVDEALKNPKVKIAWDALHRSTGLMIVAGTLRPGNAVRGRRGDGSLHHPLSTFPAVVDPRRNSVVGVHMRTCVRCRDQARRVPAGIDRHLRAHHVRRDRRRFPRRSATPGQNAGCGTGVETDTPDRLRRRVPTLESSGACTVSRRRGRRRSLTGRRRPRTRSSARSRKAAQPNDRQSSRAARSRFARIHRLPYLGRYRPRMA